MTSKSPPPPSRFKTKSPVNQAEKIQQAVPVRLKTVVRRLPPNLPEAVFWQSVEPWVSDETVSWKAFYQGKLRKKLNKENIPSRAYLLFKHEDRLTEFSRDYDGHLFRDKQGNESQAVVEFALNQKVPPEKKKVDNRHATIHQDEDFLSFVASLQNPSPKIAEVDYDALLAATQPPEEPKTTPLLAALREQKLSAQEKRLAAAEAAKVHSRKGVAAATSAQKLEVEETAPPPTKKSRRGKGAQATVPPVPVPANFSSAKPGGSRNRPGNATASSSGTNTTVPVPAPSSTTESEAFQKRNRPMLGLQSRHLKAALSGAGVSVQPAAPSGASPVSSAPTLPSAGGRAPGGAGRGGGGGGGEKRAGEKVKDTPAKHSGGRGGGVGKDKARSRHPPGAHHPPTGQSRAPDATPRILSRQDPPATVLSAVDSSTRDRAPQEGGAGRGRGGRRGRGQS